MGPMVISKKSSDGGFFWQLKNEKHVRNERWVSCST